MIFSWKESSQQFLQTFFLVVFYAAAFYLLQFFLYTTGVIPFLPNDQNIAAYDGGWYRSIAEHGYQNTAGSNNTAFFFLFPMLWNLLHLGVWGVSIMNIILFALGFSALTSLFTLTIADKILWLSIPSIYFCFVPYSEALFFFLSVVGIWGMVNKKMWLVWVSLFLLSLTRATGLFFVPALLFMQLVSNDRKDWLKNLWYYVINYFLPLFAGTVFFILYQYWKTGVWFTYFTQQTSNWKRGFVLPKFPLSGLFGGDKLLWLSAFCIFVCFVSFILLCRYGLYWLFKGRIGDRLLTLSLGYLTMVLISIIFFNPTWVSNTTNVIGANRYTLVSPFFYIFLAHFTKTVRYSWKHYAFVFIGSTFFWFLFGSYKHIYNVYFFSISTLLIMCYMAYNKEKYSWVIIPLTAFNIIFQIHFFQMHISPYLGNMTD